MVLGRVASWHCGTVGGVVGALVVLAPGRLGRSARRAGGARGACGCAGARALRLALAAIGGPRDEATSVILSLGLGLSVLAAVGQIDANLRGAIERDLPARAPSYFFVDIQNDQIDGFRERARRRPAVSAVESAPMLRGRHHADQRAPRARGRGRSLGAAAATGASPIPRPRPTARR